mgnify:CR=1 FL=1
MSVGAGRRSPAGVRWQVPSSASGEVTTAIVNRAQRRVIRHVLCARALAGWHDVALGGSSATECRADTGSGTEARAVPGRHPPRLRDRCCCRRHRPRRRQLNPPARARRPAAPPATPPTGGTPRPRRCAPRWGAPPAWEHVHVSSCSQMVAAGSACHNRAKVCE